MRYGKLSQVCERLDLEMAADIEILGPFRFTATILVYDSGHEFQMVPYDQIVPPQIEQPASDDPAAVVVHTRDGRGYQWYRTWMQGIFDPEKTIRAAAHLDDPDPSAPSASSPI
jgi:hypothetical protein